MKDLNIVSMIGRLTRAVEMRYANSGFAIASFSLAVNINKKVDGQWQDETSFFDCSYFGKGAEAISQYLQKGQQVGIQGHLEQQSWKDKTTGNNRSKVLIICDSVQLLGGQKQGSQAPQQQRQQTRHQTQNVKQNPQQSYPTPQPQQMFAPQAPVAPENFEDDSFSDVPF